MTPRHLHIAILAILVVVLAGCGQKATKRTEPASSPAASPTPADLPPPAQEPPPPAEPAAPPPQPIASPRSAQQAPAAGGPPQSIDEFSEEQALQSVFFAAGRSDIGGSAIRFMKENARWILENPGYFVLIEGHTDASGTPESRLAIADRRAKAAARFLLEEGVPNTRLFTIGHGSERPVCIETTDSCAARNRRVHFRVKKQ
jgi:peptidoglycan-associated lipoprotein